MYQYQYRENSKGTLSRTTSELTLSRQVDKISVLDNGIYKSQTEQ